MCLICTRQVPRIIAVDIEKTNDVKAQSAPQNHVFEVEIEKFFFGGMESETGKIKFRCHFVH